jgi:hypothetical protein
LFQSADDEAPRVSESRKFQNAVQPGARLKPRSAQLFSTADVQEATRLQEITKKWTDATSHPKQSKRLPTSSNARVIKRNLCSELITALKIHAGRKKVQKSSLHAKVLRTHLSVQFDRSCVEIKTTVFPTIIPMIVDKLGLRQYDGEPLSDGQFHRTILAEETKLMDKLFGSIWRESKNQNVITTFTGAEMNFSLATLKLIISIYYNVQNNQ